MHGTRIECMTRSPSERDNSIIDQHHASLIADTVFPVSESRIPPTGAVFVHRVAAPGGIAPDLLDHESETDARRTMRKWGIYYA